MKFALICCGNEESYGLLFVGGELLVFDQEINRNTDPWDSDSDDDLLTDGEEVNTYGSNPLSNDTDSDGLYDWEEVNAGVYGLLTSVDDDDSDDDDEEMEVEEEEKSKKSKKSKKK